ncbi:MAG: SufE family protein [Chloroflexi bacterium]|nr:SufE family protein [Chloroflexota bacterium]GIW10695.1 MAG: cysteine desulfuration protein SufE [Dehalococcoidia bacterium]
MTTVHLPPRLAEIVEAFQEAQGREKLELLLEFANAMPPLPEWLAQNRDQMDFVHECQTPVYVAAEMADGLQFYFDVPKESPTVRGYAGLLAEGLRGASPEEVLAVPGDFFVPMGLAEVVSHQRLNGMSAILAHMKRLALAYLPQRP